MVSFLAVTPRVSTLTIVREVLSSESVWTKYLFDSHPMPLLWVKWAIQVYAIYLVAEHAAVVSAYILDDTSSMAPGT